MTTQQLKEALIEEHKRDLRLTIIAYGLVVAGLVTLGILAYMFVWEGVKAYAGGFKEFLSNENNSIYRYIVPIALLTMLGYFVMNIVKIAKRMKTVDAFINKIEEGKIASNINERTVYKIILPLLKIKLNLCPVNFVNVVFDGEGKSYELPLNPLYMPEMKTLLSGVGAEAGEIDQAWHELYDGDTVQTTENTPLKSVEEFQSYIQNELKSDIEEIENTRKKGKSKILLYAIPTLLIMGGWMYFAMLGGTMQFDTKTILIGFVIVSCMYYSFTLFTTRKNKNVPMGGSIDVSFKTKIFKKIVHFINPSFKYIMHGHINLVEFLEMGFFEQKSYDLDGNDQIIGKHNGVPFQLCDLEVTRKRNFTRENESPDAVFYGQVFIAKFNKAFQDEVYIVPKKMPSDASLHTLPFGESVTLEDPEFMKMFKVYSNNQVEARYILSTSMMERIKNMAKQNGGKYFISFRNNRISIANYSSKNNFEVSMFKSIKDNMVAEFYDELRQQLQIIDDLKLNINIWK